MIWNINNEISVLLQFKNNLIDQPNRLSSWAGQDYCHRSSVVWDNSTSHIHEIRLRGPDDGIHGHCHGSYDTHDELKEDQNKLGGIISPSLINLKQLRYLDLSCNNFESSKIPAFIGSFKNLSYLNVSNSQFYWESINATELHFSSCELTRIPSNPTKVSFASLMVLDLSDNTFDSSLLPGLQYLVLLDLSNCYISGINPGTHRDFRNMPSLHTLRVTSNAFVNSRSILNGSSNLSDLHFLDVSNYNLSSPILGNLQNLSLIVHIELSNNEIQPLQLDYLDLESNEFHGDVSELLTNFCEYESLKLELLALQGNYLSGRQPAKLGRLKNLGSVDVAYNNFIGTIPDSLGSLSLLKTLEMNINQLAGSIPNIVGGLSSLNFLDLSYNKLNGSLPESIGQLGKLTFSSLHHNSLTSIVTEHHFANLSALKTLCVRDNKLVFKLSVTNWILPFQLDVSRIGSSSLGPSFLLWVRSQANLTELYLASANISNTIPIWIWSTFSSVTFLNISHNDILGKLGDVSFLTPGAKLDLSANHFYGLLPYNLSRPDLEFLDLSYNNLSGSLIQFLCSIIQEPRQLKVLVLGNNNFLGVIPNCWINWGSLEILDLKENKLSGEIPYSLGNISSLVSLAVHNNRPSKKLPVSLSNSKSLVIIELAENRLSRRIPTSIGGDGTSLRLLSLRSNKLEGESQMKFVVLVLFKSWILLTMIFLGTYQHASEISVSFLEGTSQVQLFFMILFSKVMDKFPYSTILYLVTTIGLSSNKFMVLTLPGLWYLNLSRNNLTGNISQRIGEMRQVESLDLSINHLNGVIYFEFIELVEQQSFVKNPNKYSNSKASMNLASLPMLFVELLFHLANNRLALMRMRLFMKLAARLTQFSDHLGCDMHL
ncbi:Leucine-rich repeat-containing protein [Cynara cardunculus var. scolymus]|uniref:Leucine-rich repeat-containing protein n=1 Tax=Cynara cardunculus var. scolymus TaxID=59895 RepID=A0A118K2I2_CYNCS|nr:Leucine-rich repeat-containing protein [Cynara cardunculus var. scolymus]